MGIFWKFSKKGTEQICGKCGIKLGFEEILLCDKCWNCINKEGNKNAKPKP